MTVTRELISSYKKDFFQFSTVELNQENSLDEENFINASTTILKLTDETNLEEYDLVFLYHALKLINQLKNENRYKVKLQHAVIVQLARYWAGLTVIINIIGCINVLLSNGDLENISNRLFMIFLANSIYYDLQILLRDGDRFDRSILKAIIQVPLKLVDANEVSTTIKTSVSNGFEFLKTNLSFFYRKLVRGQAEYNLSDELNQTRDELNNIIYNQQSLSTR